MSDSYPSIHYQWKCLQYPLRTISSDCEAINIRGAYVPCYSRDASILAVAVNQKSPADTSMLFVSPVTDMLLLSAMRGCGVRDPQTKRGKWVRVWCLVAAKGDSEPKTEWECECWFGVQW